jgi:hypothetical protein
MAITLTNANWIADDGSYGNGEVIVFEDADLTPRQHDVYENLDDEDKFDYVYAIMAGEPTRNWEE